MSRTNLLFREDPDVVVAGELEKFFAAGVDFDAEAKVRGEVEVVLLSVNVE